MLDIAKIRKDFPMLDNDLIYFDSSATSLKPEIVIDEVNDYYRLRNTNIHRGDYDLSYEVSKAYDDTRSKVANFIGCHNPKNIVYTYGTTSSLNMVAFGYGMKHLKQGDVILLSKMEHASNVLPWFKVAQKCKASIRYVPLHEDGSFDLDAYEKCFADGRVKIVSLAHISNVLGYVNPLKEIVEIAHRNKAIVNVDGAQSVPHIKVDVEDLDIDFLSFSSHKMCGPAGIGILYGKKILLEELDPTFYGGGANARFMEDGTIILKDIPERFEAGTPDVEGVLGLGRAIGYLENIGMKNIEEYQKDLSDYFLHKMNELDNVIVYNPKSTTGIITFNVKNIFAQDAASYLNKNNICVRSGNHCAKLSHHILGINDTIRASLYFYNTKEEIDRFVEVIKYTTLEKCVESIL